MKISVAKRNLLFFLVVLCIQLAIYLFLADRANLLTPPDHIHTMLQVDTYYPDIIRQAKLGRWAMIDSHTTLPAPKVYVYTFFIAAGKIAALLHIDPITMYEITRVTGAILVFVATYWLITLILPPSLHILATFFTLVVDTGPLLPESLRTVITQWTAATPSQTIIARHFGLPHHLWGEAMGLALICMILRAIKTPSHTNLIAILLLGIAGTTTVPPYFVILVTCLFGPWLLYGLVSKTFKKILPPLLLAILAILAGGLWIQLEFAKGPPFNALVDVEKSWWSLSYILVPFVQSFSLFYPFVAILILLAPFRWSTWSRNIRLMVILAGSWSALPVVLILLASVPWASWFPIANGRIATDLSPVPIGILATLGVYAMWDSTRTARIARWCVIAFLVLFTGLSLFISAIYVKQIMNQQVRDIYGEGYSWTLYATTNLWQGMMALEGVPPYSHVMILPRIGELITAYLPVRAYQGAPLTFVNWLQRRGLSHQFYTGTMTMEGARQLLTENNISYVFYGPEEKSATKTTTFYPDMLTAIYHNPEVTIFTVKRP